MVPNPSPIARPIARSSTARSIALLLALALSPIDVAAAPLVQAQPLPAGPEVLIHEGRRGGWYRPYGRPSFGPPPRAYYGGPYGRPWRPPAVVIVPPYGYGYAPPPPYWVVPPRPRHRDGWDNDLWYGPQPPSWR